MLVRVGAAVFVVLSAMWGGWLMRGERCQKEIRLLEQARYAAELAAAADAARRAAELQAGVVDVGDQTRAEHEEVFRPLREVVRYVEVDSGVCVGEFDPRVRNAIQAAVDTANSARGLPAARDP